MIVFHWAAGWNVLKICRQGLVDTGILDGEPDFRFAFSVDVLSAKPAKKGANVRKANKHISRNVKV